MEPHSEVPSGPRGACITISFKYQNISILTNVKTVEKMRRRGRPLAARRICCVKYWLAVVATLCHCVRSPRLLRRQFLDELLQWRQLASLNQIKFLRTIIIVEDDGDIDMDSYTT